MKGNRWIDPAPFEGARPQFPWWVWLPGWVKVILAPFALLWLMVRLAVKLAVLAVRYPLAVTLGLGSYAGYRQFGLSPLVLALLPSCVRSLSGTASIGTRSCGTAGTGC